MPREQLKSWKSQEAWPDFSEDFLLSYHMKRGRGTWAMSKERVEKLYGLPSVLSRKSRGKRRMKLTLAGSTAKFSSVYPLV